MKYCTNCNTYKESWSDKTSDGSSNRCWSCDKYTLTTQSQEVARRQNQTLITQTIGVAQGLTNVARNNPDVEVKYESTSGVRYETNAVIEYQTHTMTFNKK